MPARSIVYRWIPALEVLPTYTLRMARADAIAGLTVATVAVPQAMAYGIAAGVPAEHGLYTAIVMTAVGAVLASSRQLINGPTNVLSIAVLSALAGFPPELKVQGAITLCLLVGCYQTLITLLRLGDLTRYISHSVVMGFTVGASLLLVLDQVRSLFGWSAQGDAHMYFLYRLFLTWTHGGMPHKETALIGIGSMLAIVALRLFKRRVGWPLLPDLLLVVVGSAVITGYFHLEEAGVRVVGAIPPKLPEFAVPVLSWSQLRELSGDAFAIATLGLLEALAMSKNIAAQTKQKIDLNQQCLSEGLANIAGAFFQCIPGSGSIVRSAINLHAGAVSQWAGVFSATAVALIVVVFAPAAHYVPRSALAGILIVSAFSMVDFRALWFHVRATHFDLVIVVLTGVAAVAISVEFCILIGVLCSFLLAVPRAGKVSLTEFVIGEDGLVHEREDVAVFDRAVPIFGLEGELFFGSTIALEEHFAHIERRAARTTVVVLRVKRLRNPDAVGLHELDQFLRHMRELGCVVILAGVRSDLLDGLRASGILDELDSNQVFPERRTRGSSTIDAIHAAYEYLAHKEASTGSSEGATPRPTLSHFLD